MLLLQAVILHLKAAVAIQVQKNKISKIKSHCPAVEMW